MIVEHIFVVIFTFCLAVCGSDNDVLEVSPSVKGIIEEMSWAARVHVVPYLSKTPSRRREMSVASGRRQGLTNITQEELEEIAKMFTKLKESKAQSDEYVKQADKIKALYVDSPVFKIGFLEGQLDQKMHLIYNITYISYWMRWWWTSLEWVTAYEELLYIDKEVADIIKWLKEQDEKAQDADEEENDE